MPLIRLDKYISDCGVAARREIKQIIKSGRVSVNGETAALPEQKLDPETATVSLDGNVLRYEKYRYYMLNKPAGCVSATKDTTPKASVDAKQFSSRIICFFMKAIKISPYTFFIFC